LHSPAGLFCEQGPGFLCRDQRLPDAPRRRLRNAARAARWAFHIAQLYTFFCLQSQFVMAINSALTEKAWPHL